MAFVALGRGLRVAATRTRCAGPLALLSSSSVVLCAAAAAPPLPVVPVHTPACAPPGGHYSQAVVAPAGASLVFVSGMLPVTPAGEKLVDAPIEAQASCALENMRAALLAAGADLDSITKVTSPKRATPGRHH